MQDGDVSYARLENELQGFTFSLPETFNGEELAEFFQKLLSFKDEDADSLRQVLDSLNLILEEMKETSEEIKTKRLAEERLIIQKEGVSALLEALNDAGLCDIRNYEEIPAYLRLSLQDKIVID